ncbi:TMP repeat family [Streptococcus pneumoniae]|nr:TMP repeat family [Streptococcus pneumoniae]VNX14552.1 TMP repeat family [Streptococcus pneumoniae]VNZ84067.1 TMP repeat family [Streptococcus pneumoniae]
MATLDELKVMIDAEIAPFRKKMKEVENQVKGTSDQVKNATAKVREQSNSIGSAFGKLAKFAGFAILGKKLLDVGMYSTQTALEVSASMNQIKRQMGESSQSFLKWVNDNANAMNMGVGEATNYGAVYSNLFSGFIKDTNKLSAYTAKMLQTSAVVAEGSGRTITDVMERIRSGLLGNTEAIEDLGINVNVAMIKSTEAFKRFSNGQSWDQLDFQTQQQIRLMAILEQATAKYGDTLSNSVNGRISLFKSLMKDAALNLGNSMLPIINAIMPVLNSFAMVLKNVTAKLAEFIALMFNKKATVKDGVGGAVGDMGNAMKDAAGGAGDLADAVDDAGDSAGGLADNLGDSAKNAKKAAKELLGLLGFDEINILQKPKDDDAGGSGGGGKGGKGKGGGGGPFKDILPEVELTDMDNQFKSIFDGLGDKLKGLFDYLKKLWDLFKKGFSLSFRWDSIERLKNALQGIWKSIKDIFEDGTVLQAAARFGEKLAFALGQTTGALANVIMGIAVFIAESLNKSLNETKLDIKAWLIRMFDIGGEIVESVGNIAQSIGQIFYDSITSELATNMGAGLFSAFTYAFMGVKEITAKYTRDIIGAIEETITENQAGITEMFTGLFKAVEPIAQALSSSMKKLFESVNQVYDEHIKPLFKSSSALMSDVVGAFVNGWNDNIQPVLEKIGHGFADTIKNHIEPALEKIGGMIGSFADFSKAINEVFGPVISFIVEKLTVVLAPAIEYIREVWRVLFNTISDVIGGIADIIKRVFDVLTGLLTGDGEKIKEGFLSIFGGLKDIVVSVFSGIIDLVSGVLKLLWDVVVAIFKSIWDAIVAIFSGVGSWFGEKFQGAWDAIVNIFSNLGSWFGQRWADVTSALANIGAWFTNMFQKAWTGLTNIFSKLGSWFGERWNDVTSALSKVASWFGEMFTNAYNAVKNAFSSIGGFFSGVWSTVQSIFVNAGQKVGSAVGGAFRSAVNGVLGTIENVVNGFIGMINGVIGMINKIPGVSLGGIGYVSLPRLARGGIVDSPTIAMIGEAGKEAVVPLENTGFIQTLGRVVSSAVVNAMAGVSPQGGFSGDGDIVIQIAGHEFGRVAIQEINKEHERAGQTLLKI